MDKIPYGGRYPSHTSYLIDSGYLIPPRQYERDLVWASGVDIVYHFTGKGLSLEELNGLSPFILTAVEQEIKRYGRAEGRMVGASFDVWGGKGRKRTYTADMEKNPEIMVLGTLDDREVEGWGSRCLEGKIKEILDWVKRYPKSEARVETLLIRIRDPKGTV